MRRSLDRSLTIVSLTLVLASATAAQEWTRFRGPNGTGVSADTSVPAAWTEDQIAWKQALPGIGHSSPVVWGDRVFVMSADPDNATRFLLALDANDGQIVWKKDFASETYKIHLRSSFASSSPAVDESLVYFAWAKPTETTLMALTHDGDVVWQRNLGGFRSQHGFGTSPMLYKDLVILCVMQMKPDENGPETDDSFVIAVDRRTGETRWRTTKLSDTASYSVPCIWKNPQGNDELISCDTPSGIYSLDPISGKENWSLKVFEMRTVSSPIAAGGLLFGSTGSGAGGNYVAAIRPGPEPSLAYRVTQQAPYVPCMVAKDGLVFLWSDKGIVTCIRAVDGQEVWQKRIGSNFSGSPIIAGNHLYCVDDDGVVFTLAASATYELLGKTPLGEASRSTPAVANGRLFFRTYSHLIAVGK